MTLDQQIQVWNAIGTWLAGIATFAAVVVSLRLASRVDRVRLKVHAGIRLLFLGDRSPAEELLEIHVTNLGDRPVTVTSVGWAIGKRKKRRYCLQNLSGRYTAQYPKELAHGQSASFQVSFVETPRWANDFVGKFIASGGESLSTLVAQVHTSVGQAVEVWAEPNLIEKLTQVRENG
jgi:hypothetical protein